MNDFYAVPTRFKLLLTLLIDDDDCNFFHEPLLLKINCVYHIHITTNGIEAPSFLKSRIDEKYPHPGVISLNINMPQMIGWEFLEEYNNLDSVKKEKFCLSC
jgi:CheY-like chemotaxis protein